MSETYEKLIGDLSKQLKELEYYSNEHRKNFYAMMACYENQIKALTAERDRLKAENERMWLTKEKMDLIDSLIKELKSPGD